VQGVSPLTESNGGLAESLNRLVNRAAAVGHCAIRFRSAGELPPSLNLYTRNQLYRVAQEALNSALTYSRGGSIEVSLEVEPRCIRIRVACEGRDNMPQAAAQSNFGMATMKFRAAAINARISIDPNPAGGTILICECPHEVSGIRN
jgi:signal transduction histidine kinase